MALNRTFTMIKPDAVKKGYIGPILNKINVAGFKIVSMKMTQLSKEMPNFYSIHKDRPFFNDLVAFMTSGPIVAAVLEKDNAVNDLEHFLALPVLRRLQMVHSVIFSQHPLEKIQYIDLIVTITLLLKLDSISLIEKFFSEK